MISTDRPTHSGPIAVRRITGPDNPPKRTRTTRSGADLHSWIPPNWIAVAEQQCIEYDTVVKFAETLFEARMAAGLTQAELSTRSGIARPNIAAFEAGRRDPRWDTAIRTLEAAGAVVEVVEPITWTWTAGRRPYAVPSRLWRLDLRDSFRVLTPGLHLWWSGPALRLDLANRADRIRAYELILREGAPEDIGATVDGALLIDAWPDLVLPTELRQAWQPVLDRARPELADAS